MKYWLSGAFISFERIWPVADLSGDLKKYIIKRERGLLGNENVNEQMLQNINGQISGRK